MVNVTPEEGTIMKHQFMCPLVEVDMVQRTHVATAIHEGVRTGRRHLVLSEMLGEDLKKSKLIQQFMAKHPLHTYEINNAKLPHIMEQCLVYIKEHGTREAGLFRLAGDHDTIAKLRLDPCT